MVSCVWLCAIIYWIAINVANYLLFNVLVLLIAHSIYCGVTRTHPGGGSTCIKNVANEELVSRLFYGHEAQERIRYTVALIILTV